jgi:hypothetical protein
MSCFGFAALIVMSLLPESGTNQIPKVERTWLQFDLFDLSGTIHSPGQNERGLLRAYVFLSTTCPIANSYTPELNRLADEFKGRVEIFGVLSEPDVSRRAAQKHFAEFELRIPVLFDSSNLLLKELKPSHVPQVFLLNTQGQIVYKGAIDNAYESIGRRRATVEHHYLKSAITSVLAGEPVAKPETSPVGCIVPPLDRIAKESSITYCRDIAPLIQTRCQNCHRPGQVAPFSLTTFEEAAKHAEMLVEVTQKRIMPPWMPGQDSEHRFVGERWLTNHELDLLKDWVAAGCPKGDEADLPPAPKFAEGWQLGAPDLIVRMPEPFTVPADGPDLLQNFVIPLGTDSDHLVAVVEFHPGNKRVVHHAVLFLDSKGQARKLDGATPEPGYANFGGPGFLPDGALGGWSVGNTARRLPNDMGRYLKKGSDLVVQIHYHPTGKEEVDQSEIGLYFVKKPVEESLKESAKLVGSIWMANYEMDIPAGNANYRRSTAYRLPKDSIMVGIVPHMHLLGKSMKVTARLPDKSTAVLIDVPNWNYNWQDEYYFQRPFKLPAGTVLIVEAAFDNSDQNPSNPSSPPKRVTWGEETDDEMLFCFFLLTADKTEDLIHVIFDNLAHDLKQSRKEISNQP